MRGEVGRGRTKGQSFINCKALSVRLEGGGSPSLGLLRGTDFFLGRS